MPKASDWTAGAQSDTSLRGYGWSKDGRDFVGEVAGLSIPLELNELEYLEEDLGDNEDDHEPLQHVGVGRVQLVGEHVEELLDEVEPLIQHVHPPLDLEVLGHAHVDAQPLVILPEEVWVLEHVRVQVDGGAVDKQLANHPLDVAPPERDLAVARHPLRDVAGVCDQFLDGALEHAELRRLREPKRDRELLSHLPRRKHDDVLVKRWPPHPRRRVGEHKVVHLVGDQRLLRVVALELGLDSLLVLLPKAPQDDATVRKEESMLVAVVVPARTAAAARTLAAASALSAASATAPHAVVAMSPPPHTPPSSSLVVDRACTAPLPRTLPAASVLSRRTCPQTGERRRRGSNRPGRLGAPVREARLAAGAFGGPLADHRPLRRPGEGAYAR
mmetsp:Transcript_49277/g.164526  ORF Transcript_49277/g.164526 Transcript_49277/m.164526 type:complete len:387 (+) Transcript_49277:107-1267(+)